MSGVATEPDGGVSLLVLRVHMSAPVQHQLDKKLVALVGGDGERSVPRRWNRRCIDIGALFQKNSANIDVPAYLCNNDVINQTIPEAASMSGVRPVFALCSTLARRSSKVATTSDRPYETTLEKPTKINGKPESRPMSAPCSCWFQFEH